MLSAFEHMKKGFKKSLTKFVHNNATSEQHVENSGFWEKEPCMTVRDEPDSRARRKRASAPYYGSGNYGLNISLVKWINLGPNYL